MSYPSFRKCKIAAGVFWLFAVLNDTTRMAGTEGREGGGATQAFRFEGLVHLGGRGEGGCPNGGIAGTLWGVRCQKRWYVGRVLILY